MSYTPPSVGSGWPDDTFAITDILADNLAQFHKIYGAESVRGQRIRPSTSSFRLLSLKQSDCCAATSIRLQPIFAAHGYWGGARSHRQTQRTLRGLPYTYSTAVLTVSGTSGTVITNGMAQDTNGNQWLLPATRHDSHRRQINVTATCSTPGNITAEPGTITIIASPTGGWASVNNTAGAAIPGTPNRDRFSTSRAPGYIGCAAFPNQTRRDRGRFACDSGSDTPQRAGKSHGIGRWLWQSCALAHLRSGWHGNAARHRNRDIREPRNWLPDAMAT